MPMPWEQDYHGETGAPATGGMPWEKDYGEEDFFHPKKPAPGSGWKGVLERLGQYPRIAMGEIGDAFHTLGKVAHGEIDATDPEAIKASTNVASMMSPAGEFAGTGGQIARMAEPGYTATPKLSPGIQAAQTAADLGSPLPAGVVSDTPGMKAFTQGFRQVPFVGPAITEKVGNTVKAAGRRVGDISEELSGGPVSDRATVGASTNQALQDVIEGNNAKIDAAYDDLRSNHIDPDALASLPRTESALKGILRERGIAGMANPKSGLADVANLADKGTSFNGLVRARNDVGSAIAADKANPNPGFNAGDQKRLYAAMSADMEGIARYHAKADPDDAVAAFRAANGTAQDLINRNGAIRRLIGNKSDEGMLGSIINSARDKGGNLRQLTELRQQLPKEDFEKISGIALNELGHTPEGFSLNQFAGKKGWGGLSPSAKSVLISDPAHRKALDDIAGLGSFLKDADKYRSTSNTPHGGGVIGSLVALGEAAREPQHIPYMLGLLAGGYGISKILARPASASALRRWLDTAAKQQNPAGRFGSARAARDVSAISIATRNLLNNLPDEANGQENAKREPLRVTVHPKMQERAPSVPPR